MKGLEFSTVAVISAFLLLVMSAVMIQVSRSAVRKSGFRLAVAGMHFIAASCLTEGIRHPSTSATIFWSYVSIAAAVIGFALVLGGIQAILGMRSAIRWNGFIAAAHTLAVVILCVWFRKYLGLRSAVYSLASILLAFPLLRRDFRMNEKLVYQRVLDALVFAFTLVSATRLAFGLLDIVKDKFLPAGIDSWLYLIISASGLGTIVIAILEVHFKSRLKVEGREQWAGGKPALSLAERGLSRSEIRFTLALLGGKTVKEIAVEAGLSHSTIRNTLARSYKKLGVPNMVGLTVLAGSNEIVE